MHVHLVFVTKYRREVFTKEILDALHVIFAQTCLDFEAELVEFDGEDDHVRLLVNYAPPQSSAAMRSIQIVPPRVLLASFAELVRVLPKLPVDVVEFCVEPLKVGQQVVASLPERLWS